MKTIDFERISRNSAIIAAAIIITLIFIVPASRLALAENDANNKKDAPKEAVKSGVMLKIGQGGDVDVSGMRITSVNGMTLSGTIAWPAGIMPWTVVTDANTKFSGNGDNRTELGTIVAGDIVTVRGALRVTTPFTVHADSVREIKETKPANPVRTTIQGKLVSITGTVLPLSLVIRSGTADYVVHLASDTSVLGVLWMRTAIANFRIGDTVRAYGVVDADAHTVNATVVRDTNIGWLGF